MLMLGSIYERIQEITHVYSLHIHSCVKCTSYMNVISIVYPDCIWQVIQLRIFRIFSYNLSNVSFTNFVSCKHDPTIMSVWYEGKYLNWGSKLKLTIAIGINHRPAWLKKSVTATLKVNPNTVLGPK